MMKVLTALMVLLTISTALAADVTISCAQVGTTNEVTVSYAADTEAHKPRSIALDIQLSAGTITNVTKLTNNKYWVYPGTIDVNQPAYDGTPVAAGGVGFNYMSIEMASLHEPTGYNDPNAPAQSGEIIRFNVTPIVGTCTVTISGNAQRNNVVRYDVQEATVTYTGCTVAAPALCPGDVTGTVTGLVTGPPPGFVKTFNINLWTGPNGVTDSVDVQALIYLLTYTGVNNVVTPVPTKAAAGDVTGTVTGLVTGPPPGFVKTFNKALWTGPNGTLNAVDVQALIYLLAYNGTNNVYTCP